MHDWSDIRFFLALAREGSALAAARQLNTNQTTVSRRIDRLEHALRLQLFEKSSRGYALTRNGAELLPIAERMEAIASKIENHADRVLRHMSGTIRFSGLVTTMRLYGLRIIDEFRELHPRVQFEVNTQETHVSLEQGECDIAMRSTDRVTGDTLIARKIDDHPWAFYGSRDYLDANATPRSMVDLSECALLAYGDAFADKVEILGGLRARLPEAKIVFRVDTPEAMRAVIRTGAGIGLLPRVLGDEDADLSLCFGEPGLTHPIWLVASQDACAAPLTRAFWDFFCARIPDLRKIYADVR